MMKGKVWITVVALLAMGMMVSPAMADIQHACNGLGDALIFPYFDADKTNIVTISNESASWMQIHVRLRTGAHCVEGRDFPLIMSPGDMVVFEVSRDGNAGMWVVDQTLDPNNFRYVRVNSSPLTCLNTMTLQNEYLRLEPAAPCGFTADEKTVNEKYGYIEVFGEAVFVQNGVPGVPAAVPGGTGVAALDKLLMLAGNCTNTWQYYINGGRLADVPNVLYGKMYIMDSLNGTGVAYTATTLANFRTNNLTTDDGLSPIQHRVENYVTLVAPFTVIDRGVILISENATLNNNTNTNRPDAEDYTYHYDADGTRYAGANNNARYESMVAANNTWGPTLADGDSYFTPDDLDIRFGIDTSVREAEDAIRHIAIRGHYFNQTNFQTNLIVTLPTKHHVVVDPVSWGATWKNWESWKCAYLTALRGLKPSYAAAVYDTDEAFKTGPSVFDISPYVPGVVTVNTFPWEVNKLVPGTDYTSGRFVLYGFNDAQNLLEFYNDGALPLIALTFIDQGSGKTGYMTECNY